MLGILLLGSFACLLHRGSSTAQLYLAEAGGILTLLHLAGEAWLLVRRLWQRRWAGAAGVGLLLADGLAWGECAFLLAVSWA